jgi:hypothetical protein
MKKIIQNITMYIGIWGLTRTYQQIDMFLSKDKKSVLGVTFSNNKKYMDYVNKFKQK